MTRVADNWQPHEKLTHPKPEKLSELCKKLELDLQGRTTTQKQQACFRHVWEHLKRNEFDKVRRIGYHCLWHAKNVVGKNPYTYTVDDHIEMNEELSILDDSGTTFLHVAAENGDDIEPYTSIDINQKNRQGETPLAAAVRCGQVRAVDDLIHRGSSQEGVKGVQLTDWAAQHGQFEVFCLLFNHPECHFQSPQVFGNALQAAIRANQVKFVSDLLDTYRTWCHEQEKQNPLEYVCSTGQTPLIAAVDQRKFEIAALLISHGAKVNAKTEEGHTALHIVAKKSASEVDVRLAGLLVKMGADTGLGSDYKNSPGYLADTSNGKYSRRIKDSITNTSRLKNQLKKTPPDFSKDPIHYLVLSGGGVKGGGYIGLVEALIKNQRFDDIRGFAGTSAGAITSTLLAFGYGHNIRNVMREKNFDDFLDGIAKDLFASASLRDGLSKQGDKLKAFCDQPSKQKVAEVRKIYTELCNFNGLCDGERFREWIDEKISNAVREVTGKDHPNITFGELRELCHKRKLRHLSVYVSFIDSKTIGCLSSYDRKSDDIVVWSATTASMTFPGVFKSRYLMRKMKDGTLKEARELGRCADGGMLANYPVNAFDQKRFTGPNGNPAYASNEDFCPVFNKNTLGVVLRSSKDKDILHKPDQSLGPLNFLKSLIGIYLESANLIAGLNDYEKYRTLPIDVDVNTLDFGISPEERERLFDAGIEGYNNFMGPNRKNIELNRAKAWNNEMEVQSSNLSNTQTHPLVTTLSWAAIGAYTIGSSIFTGVNALMNPVPENTDQNGNSPLHNAVKKKSPRAVSEQLKSVSFKPWHLTYKNNDGEMPIHLATSIEVVDLLVHAGANIDEKNSHGRTLLHTAIEREDVAFIKKLLQKGADPNVEYQKGKKTIDLAKLSTKARDEMCDLISCYEVWIKLANDPFVKKAEKTLGWSISERDRDYVLYLLNIAIISGWVCHARTLSKSRKIDPDVGVIADGSGLLHICNEASINFLHEMKANPNKRDNCGNTPLHTATKNRDRSRCMSLLAIGCDIKLKNDHGKTPLSIAIANNDKFICNLFFEKMAWDRNLAKKLWNEASNAPELQKDICYKAGLSRITSMDLHRKGTLGRTALYDAAYAGDLTRAKDLIFLGADVNSQCEGNWSPLSAAILNNHFEIVSELLKHQCKIETKYGQYERTALMLAAEKKEHPDILSHLIAHKAMLDMQDKDGWTALHLAINFENTAGAQELISKGAALKVVTLKGFTALGIARLKNNQVIIKQIEQKLGIKPPPISNNDIVKNFDSSYPPSIPTNVPVCASNNNLGYSGQHSKNPCRYVSKYRSLGESKLGSVQTKNKTRLFYSRENNSWLSLLHRSAEKGDLMRLKRILENGNISVNNRYRINGISATPLWRAAEKGHYDCVEYLIKRRARLNIETDQDGLPGQHSPIWEAAINLHVECVKLLHAHGADTSRTKTDVEIWMNNSYATSRRREEYKEIYNILCN